MSRSAAMTIAVEFEIRRDSTSTEEWLDVWSARARDALDHEPATTAYEAAIARSDADRVLVFERYEGGESALHEHMKRPAHTELLSTMESNRMTRRRPWIAMGYEVEGFGWRVAPQAAGGVQGHGLALAIVAVRCPEPEAFFGLCRSDADDGFSNQPGTLLYGLSTVSVEDRKDFDLREGDFVVSLAFGDREALEAHMAGPSWKELVGQTRRLGGRVLLSRDYATSGRGFVWRGAAG